MYVKRLPTIECLRSDQISQKLALYLLYIVHVEVVYSTFSPSTIVI